MMGALYEASCLDSAITEQDEHDRHSIVLMGYRDNLQAMDQPRPRAPPPKQSSILQRSLPRLNSSSLMRKYSSPGNVISIEQNAMKLAGQSSHLVSAFKMACLAYNPSPVGYRGKSYDRLVLLRVRNKLLQEYWRRLENLPLLQVVVSQLFKIRNQI